ncbi:MAG: DegT/DnrJ/EryC1/StrS family aminotransferase [Gammaproteobacteria bacterium]|nr:DegT/DnrJ/EryC1/StrS family aminotransferase [Gammaproteobacteria bacterium]
MLPDLPPWPVYSEAERTAVARVLERGLGNYWYGSEGKAFEQEFASYCGANHGLAVANGTVALELCLRALGVGPGDEVVTTPRSFIATANSIVLCGARPVFADVDPDSQNITPASVEAVITGNTCAILVVHLAGWPCDMAGLRELAAAKGLHLVEDCAQAHGAAVSGAKVGSLGDIAAFSFCHDKIISTGGEGGMLITNDEELWAKAAAFRNHGRDPRSRPGDNHEYQYLHGSAGSNYRMTEMQSAIGRHQLTRLGPWLEERRRNAALLRDALHDLEILRIPAPADHISHAFYRFYVFLNRGKLRPEWDRARIIDALRNDGIPCDSGICPEIYREPAYRDTSTPGRSRLPAARELGETAIAFPVYPGIGDELMAEMAGSIRAVLTRNFKS